MLVQQINRVPLVKCRLDVMVASLRSDLSRTMAAEIIRSGMVSVDGDVVTKASALVSDSSYIEIASYEQKFVSRAGLKLEFALDCFDIDVSNLVVLDSGLSTGGFADCLLSRGVGRVFGVDVGHDQIHQKLKNC
ncbi:TlyA family RNA methyltransferase, partial [Candidatus Babeliales bacterium]|nr:TlyA family RNA methyltransferase [Candidatus Babeliales bacterium]